MHKFLENIWFTRLFYVTGILLAFLFAAGYFLPWIFSTARFLLVVFAAFILADLGLLFSKKSGFKAIRELADRFSNSDKNEVKLMLRNEYPFPVKAEIIDEIPPEFQERHFSIRSGFKPWQEETFDYHLTPKERGTYHFAQIRIFVQSPLHLAIRRYTLGNPDTVKVYPSFLQMRKFELLAATDRLTEAGIKSVRRVGHQLEFDQIRDYVQGDDSRTINWKATALKARLMVNQYQDEKSQPVYSMIDMGRTMQQPFDGMTLLDYSINAALAISNIAMLRHDRVGLITFNTKIETFLPADRKRSHLMNLMELLYNQETRFAESNPEVLCSLVSRKLRHRSLLILYTHFEGLPSLQRQLPYFRQLARYHPLLVVFFENREVAKLADEKPMNTEEIYIQTIAGQLLDEQHQIVKELQRYGIYALLTPPEKLSTGVINKYLEFKARRVV